METIIRSGLDSLGLSGAVPEDAPAKLAEYGRLLLEQNRVMNLTAIREEEGVARLHMLDCAALLLCADFRGKTLIDVGTGAGFPGLVLKILVPSLQVTLLDSLGKRAEEQALVRGFRDAFDFASARAVADLRLLCELSLPFVRPGGTFLAMKSVDSGAELEGAAHTVKLLGGRADPPFDYAVPGTGITHRVLPIRKVAPTLKGYPRRWARIQKEPL